MGSLETCQNLHPYMSYILVSWALTSSRLLSLLFIIHVNLIFSILTYWRISVGELKDYLFTFYIRVELSVIMVHVTLATTDIYEYQIQPPSFFIAQRLHLRPYIQMVVFQFIIF